MPGSRPLLVGKRGSFLTPWERELDEADGIVPETGDRGDQLRFRVPLSLDGHTLGFRGMHRSRRFLPMSFTSLFRWEAISASVQPSLANRRTVASSCGVQGVRGLRAVVVLYSKGPA